MGGCAWEAWDLCVGFVRGCGVREGFGEHMLVGDDALRIFVRKVHMTTLCAISTNV